LSTAHTPNSLEHSRDHYSNCALQFRGAHALYVLNVKPSTAATLRNSCRARTAQIRRQCEFRRCGRTRVLVLDDAHVHDGGLHCRQQLVQGLLTAGTAARRGFRCPTEPQQSRRGCAFPNMQWCRRYTGPNLQSVTHSLCTKQDCNTAVTGGRALS
jgi:hypothetical protein